MYFTDRAKENIKNLYDRKKEIEDLKKALERKRALTLVLGIRRFGKTSLVKSVLNEIKAEYIFFDLRRLEEFTIAPYSILLREISSPLNDFLERHKGFAKYLKNIKGIKISELGIEFEWKRERTSMADILDAIDKWAKKSKNQVIIVFDEAQLIKNIKIDFSNILAYAYDNLSNIQFILTGSEIGMLYDLLKFDDGSSPLYGRHREEILLSRFTKEESIDFLRKGFKEFNISPDEKILEEVWEELDGIVGWLSLFGLRAVDKGLSDELIKGVVDEASKLVEREIKKFLSRRTSKRYEIILKSLSLNPLSFSEIKRAVEVKEGSIIYDKNLSTLLENLQKVGFIKKENSMYNLSSKILRYAVKRL